MNRLRWMILVPLCVAATGCAPRAVRLTTPCMLAGERLNSTFRLLEEARQLPGGCDPEAGMHCENLREKIERLGVDCPSHPRVRIANALLAFDAHQYARAQQILDELAATNDGSPEASILRARIALQEGNTRFALRFLETEIRQHGDHPGLREMLGSALYLTGRWEDAGEQLRIAERLGSPPWRLAYHRGLIAEAARDYIEAKHQYQESMRMQPAFRPTASRLRALMATGKIPE